MDELNPKRTTSKWQYQKSRGKPYDKMDKIIEEAVQRSEGRFNVEHDDTDSVASSRSSVIITNNLKRKTGVSPLNRRTSVRLAMKKDSTMQIGPSLQSQNTVIMQTPPVGLLRMETSTRWTHHRGATKTRLETQETVAINANNTSAKTGNNVRHTNVPRGVTKWVKHRGEQLKLQSTEVIPTKKSRMSNASVDFDETDGNNSGSLLKKMSTTWGLRKMLGKTGLGDISTGSQQATEGIDEVDCGESNHLEQTHRKSKLKRKASQQLSVIEETSPKKGILSRKKTTSRVSKQVTVVAPNEEKPVRRPQPKRQLSLASSFSVGSDECLLNRAKRMKIQKSVNQQAEVFFPSERTWPVHMNAQVVWDLPLSDDSGQSPEASSVCVNTTRCVIGQRTGSVVELNAAVVPQKKVVLPAGVNTVKCVENKVVVGCGDGGLYDITNGEAQLLWRNPKVGEIMKIAATKDQIAIGGKEKLALLNGDFQMQWVKEEGATEESWLVAVDNNAVYHGQSDFITKNSLDDGSRIWQTAGHITCKPCGSESLDFLYVSLGNEVAKMNKYRGTTEKRYAQGSSLTNNIHSIAVGGGLVFAAGSRLVCYHEESGEIVFVVRISNDAKIVDMQYFQARLFCLSVDCLHVLDFTENSVKTGMDGNTIECTTVSSDVGASSSGPYSNLTRDSSFTSVSSEGSTADSETCKPKPRSGKLRVKALSVRNSRKR